MSVYDVTIQLVTLKVKRVLASSLSGSCLSGEDTASHWLHPCTVADEQGKQEIIN
jgi:hypothetical protein